MQSEHEDHPGVLQMQQQKGRALSPQRASPGRVVPGMPGEPGPGRGLPRSPAPPLKSP